MTVKIKEHFSSFPTQEVVELKRALTATQADLASLRTSILGITAQLDADTGVNDITYAANNNPLPLILIP